MDAASIAAAVEGELRRLQTDHVDLLQLHWPDRYVPSFGAHQYHPEVNPQPCLVLALRLRDGAIRRKAECVCGGGAGGGGQNERVDTVPFAEQVEAVGRLIRQGKVCTCLCE